MVDVVCGVIWSSDGRYLLAQRPLGRIWSGYWEFPGGKIEPGEPAEAAMTRELQEELGITVTRADPWLLKVFEYPHATVRLHFFHVREWSGTPRGLEGQALHWQSPSTACGVDPLLPANAPILRSLAMPAVLPVTPSAEVAHSAALALVAAGLSRGWPLEFEQRSGLACASASDLEPVCGTEGGTPTRGRWLQVRRGALSMREWREWSDLCVDHGVVPIMNTSVEEALAFGVGSLHLNAARLAALHARPELPLVGASVHSREEIERASALGLDYVILGSVNTTPSHRARDGLGWPAWQAIARWSPIPVYAIGGLDLPELDEARRRGASGIAMIGAAWRAP